MTLDLRREDAGSVLVHLRLVPVVRDRRLVAVEGVVTLAVAAVTATASPGPGPLSEPTQQRLASLLYEVHGLLHGRVTLPADVTSAAASRRPTLTLGDIAIDTDRMRTTLAGAPVDLTTRELLLLRYLVEHRGRVATRAQLLEHVWGYQYTGDDRTVDVHVSRLRRKLPPLRKVLRAVKHLGYLLEPAEPAHAARKVANS